MTRYIDFLLRQVSLENFVFEEKENSEDLPARPSFQVKLTASPEVFDAMTLDAGSIIDRTHDDEMVQDHVHPESRLLTKTDCSVGDGVQRDA